MELFTVPRGDTALFKIAWPGTRCVGYAQRDVRAVGITVQRLFNGLGIGYGFQIFGRVRTDSIALKIRAFIWRGLVWYFNFMFWRNAASSQNKNSNQRNGEIISHEVLTNFLCDSMLINNPKPSISVSMDVPP